MGSLNEFRNNAAQCAKLASVTSREADKLALLELAQSWLWLAELTQRSDVDADADLQVPALSTVRHRYVRRLRG
jgi:hypothetical protein